jgi:hypothetical protein
VFIDTMVVCSLMVLFFMRLWCYQRKRKAERKEKKRKKSERKEEKKRNLLFVNMPASRRIEHFDVKKTTPQENDMLGSDYIHCDKEYI